MKRITDRINNFIMEATENHTGAYAAQSAYFWVLSLIPCILLLLTLVQYTPVTKADVMTAVVHVFPKSINTLIISIVNQVYNQSKTMIPLTLLVAMWSAGRGVLSMTSGLNCVYSCPETRNYVYLRIRAALYTLLMLVSIVVTLIMLVFGNSISLFVNENVPILSNVTDFIIETRAILAVCLLTVVFMMVYKFLPNRKNGLTKQFPGAVTAAIGWMFASYIFSVYVDIFKGFADMYGSLTTIVLIMLWLYFCMYIVLLGGQINVLIYRSFWSEEDEEDSQEMLEQRNGFIKWDKESSIEEIPPKALDK